MKSIPIETNQLILKNFTEEDCKSVYHNRADAVTRRYFPGGAFSLEDAKNWIIKEIEAQKENPIRPIGPLFKRWLNRGI